MVSSNANSSATAVLLMQKVTSGENALFLTALKGNPNLPWPGDDISRILKACLPCSSAQKLQINKKQESSSPQAFNLMTQKGWVEKGRARRTEQASFKTQLFKATILIKTRRNGNRSGGVRLLLGDSRRRIKSNYLSASILSFCCSLVEGVTCPDLQSKQQVTSPCISTPPFCNESKQREFFLK